MEYLKSRGRLCAALTKRKSAACEKKIRSLTSVSFATIMGSYYAARTFARSHIGPRVFNFAKKGIYRDDNDNLKRASKRERESSAQTSEYQWD